MTTSSPVIKQWAIFSDTKAFLSSYPFDQIVDETVSLGVTAISLHILQLNSKCQDLPKFQFRGSGGRVFCSSQNSKCQDLHKFQFSAGVGGGGVFCSSHFLEGLGSQTVPHILRIYMETNNYTLAFLFFIVGTVNVYSQDWACCYHQ